MSAILKPAELLYQTINGMRRWLYRRGAIGPRRLPRPVVSIGNLSVGGSGKTPLTIRVVGILTDQGLRVAVLTRGYRRTGKDDWAVVDSADAARFGDEPVLLARRLPESSVVVGADRYLSGMAFLETADCDVFVLDDGFQHLQLHRDLDIVIDDRGARWNRESKRALADADICITRVDSLQDAARDGWFLGAVEPAAVRQRGQRRPLGEIRGVRCVAMAGLARNERFFAMLEKVGAVIVKTWSFPDHHDYSAADLEAVEDSRLSSGAELIVTTEKDAVKLPAAFDCSVIEVEMRIIPEDLFRARLLETIANLRNMPR